MDTEDFWRYIRFALGIAVFMGVFMALDFADTALKRFKNEATQQSEEVIP